jgi:putative methanogenesis marker protein 12
MVFVGIDHGTTAIRVAFLDRASPEKARTFELLKDQGPIDFMAFLGSNVDLKDIELIAIAYSMGDGISAIRPLKGIKNRGVVSLEGIGPMTGIGTKMFDEVAASGLPAVALPGLHDRCGWLDPRFTILQSHIASPKKVAASFHCFQQMSSGCDIKDAIVANASSNSVTVLIKDRKFVGGIDAALGALGLRHGPLDVEAIRRADAGDQTANEAFSTGGILRPPLDTPEKFFQAVRDGNVWAKLRLEALIMALTMEISGLRTIAGEIDAIAMTGSLGELKEPVDIGQAIGQLLNLHIHVFSRFSAAIGAAEMAIKVMDREKEIMGIPVELGKRRMFE